MTDYRALRSLSCALFAIFVGFSFWGPTAFAEEVNQEEEETRDEPPSTAIREIVVSGSPWMTPEELHVIAPQVVTRDDIVNRNAATASESIALLPGVRVESGCSTCGFTSLRISGLTGPYAVVLQDGLPVMTALSGVYGLEQIPAEMIGRVEVLQGGATAGHGPSTAGGVVDIITRAPLQSTQTVRAETGWVGVGERNAAHTTRASFYAAHVPDATAIQTQVHGTVLQRDGLDTTGDGFTELPQLRTLALGGDVRARPFPRSELRVGATAVSESRRGGDRLRVPPHESEVSESIDTFGWSTQLRFDHAPRRFWDYRLAYVYAHTQRQSYYGGGGPLRGPGGAVVEGDMSAVEDALGGYGRTANPLHVADGRLRIRSGGRSPHTVSIGAQFQSDSIRDQFVGYGRALRVNQQRLGAYVQDHWSLHPTVDVIAGARVDVFDSVDGAWFTPRATVLWSPVPALTVRGTVSTGVVAPAIFDEDLHVETVGGAARLVRNAHDLRPERSTVFRQHVTLAKRWTGGARGSLGFGAFQTRTNHLMVLETGDNLAGGEIDVLRRNQGSRDLYGGEVEGTIATQRAAVRVGWAALDGRVSEPDEDFDRRLMYRAPSHGGYLEVVAEPGPLRIQAAVEVYGPMWVPRYGTAPTDTDTVVRTPWMATASSVVRMPIATREGSGVTIEPYLDLRNILGAWQRDFGPGDARDAGYVYGPPLPRTIMVGLRLTSG